MRARVDNKCFYSFVIERLEGKKDRTGLFYVEARRHSEPWRRIF